MLGTFRMKSWPAEAERARIGRERWVDQAVIGRQGRWCGRADNVEFEKAWTRFVIGATWVVKRICCIMDLKIVEIRGREC
jgi:hypothetical protein